MNKDEELALEESIKVWKSKLDQQDPNNIKMGVFYCPLCVQFHGGSKVDDVDHCRGCPVLKKTGKQYCNGTPFVVAHDAWYQWRWVYNGTKHNKLFDAATIARSKARFLKAATEEVAFLKSLRIGEKK